MVEAMSRKQFAIFVLGMVWMLTGADVNDQSAPTIHFPQLQQMIGHESDTTFVYNFWATWCSPCVKEFPDFQALESKFPGSKLKVVFISLDFLKDKERALLPFVKKHDVRNSVYLLDETDYNSWIDKVDSSWEGNLPATLVVNNSKHVRRFYPQEFAAEALSDSVKQFLN